MLSLKKWDVPPGSPEAVEQGCLCPVIDNASGKGFMGGVKDENGETVFIYHWRCPLHGVEEVPDNYETI